MEEPETGQGPGNDVRIVVADDHPLMLRAISEMVNDAEGLTVVGTAGNGAEAVRLVRELGPELLMTDLDMPERSGVEAIQEVAGEGLARCLALTTFSALNWVVEALRAGASGYLLKDSAPEEIIGAVRQVLDDDMVLAPPVVRLLARQVTSGPSRGNDAGSVLASVPEISQREREVVELLAGGLNNKEIAAELFLSEGAVKLHLGKACERLGARDRVQLLVRAVELGLVTPSLLRPETAQDRFR